MRVAAPLSGDGHLSSVISTVTRQLCREEDQANDLVQSGEGVAAPEPGEVITMGERRKPLPFPFIGSPNASVQ